MLSTRTQAAFQRALAGSVSPAQLSQIGMATGNCNLPMEHRANSSNVHQNAFNNNNNYNGDYRYNLNDFQNLNNEYGNGQLYNNPFNYFDSTSLDFNINDILEHYWEVFQTNTNEWLYEDHSTYDFSNNAYSHYQGGVLENISLGDTNFHSNPNFNTNQFFGGPVNHNYGPQTTEGDTHNYGDVNFHGDEHNYGDTHHHHQHKTINENGDNITYEGPINIGPNVITNQGDVTNYGPTFFGPTIIGGPLPKGHLVFTWRLTAEKITNDHIKLDEIEEAAEDYEFDLPDIECIGSTIQYAGSQTINIPLSQLVKSYRYTLKVEDTRKRWNVVAFANTTAARHFA
jgi:hypothetical protein|tara:strand:- start:2018 stop:3043 length:1026 start_codon:yes stop_codon:yes gene_type:complete